MTPDFIRKILHDFFMVAIGCFLFALIGIGSWEVWQWYMWTQRDHTAIFSYESVVPKRYDHEHGMIYQSTRRIYRGATFEGDDRLVCDVGSGFYKHAEGTWGPAWRDETEGAEVIEWLWNLDIPSDGACYGIHTIMVSGPRGRYRQIVVSPAIVIEEGIPYFSDGLIIPNSKLQEN